MNECMTAKRAALLLFFLLCHIPVLAQQPCSDSDIKLPEPPTMLETHLGLLLGSPGQPALPEWSKIEKLRAFYKKYTAANSSCLLLDNDEVDLQLFLDRASVTDPAVDEKSGRFTPEKSLQFFGTSRVKVERADKQVTRRYAFPLQGPAEISDVAETPQLDILLEDLAQIQVVSVPRLEASAGGPGSAPQGEACYTVSSVTAVPSRVFDPRLESPDPQETGVHLSLDARRRALEHVAFEVRWLDRLTTEFPGCQDGQRAGYWSRQIRSLNLTVQELVPEMDFVAETLRFWQDVEQRVELLRAEDEGWKQEIAPGSQAQQ